MPQIVDNDRNAAGLTMTILEASLGDGVAPQEHVYFAGEPNPVSREAAINQMARLPKPVVCRSRLIGPGIEIACEGIEDPEMISLHEYNVRTMERGQGLVGPIREKSLHDGDVIMILVKTMHSSFLLDLVTVENWVRYYLISQPFAIDGREPKPEEEPSGASWVLLPGSLEAVR